MGPPVGQGINAAMEAAAYLDKSIGSTGNLQLAIEDFTEKWKPQADACNWIANTIEFGNRKKMALLYASFLLNVNAATAAKSSKLSYKEVYDKAINRQNYLNL